MRFTKKPVTIEAVQFNEEGFSESPSWLLDALSSQSNPLGCIHKMRDREGRTRLSIDTLEGAMAASYGDWIIQGIKGEIYPCKPNIFELTYEPSPEEAPADCPLDAIHEDGIEVLNQVAVVGDASIAMLRIYDGAGRVDKITGFQIGEGFTRGYVPTETFVNACRPPIGEDDQD